MQAIFKWFKRLVVLAILAGAGYAAYAYFSTKKQAAEVIRYRTAPFVRMDLFRTVEARDGSFCDEGLSDFLSETSGGNSELLRWRKALEADLGIRPMAEYDGRPIYKVVFMCKDVSQLAPAIEALEKDFFFLVQDMAAANCLNGELVNRKFDKGLGIRRVCEALGYDVKDTVGFGDSMNDLEMIQTVGTSVCMANGSPKLQKMSDLVCPAVEEDGLAKGFETLGLVNSDKNEA